MSFSICPWSFSGPTSLFEFLFRKAEIVAEFVDERLANLRLEFDFGAAHGRNGQAEQRDSVGVQDDAVGTAVNQGDAFVEAQQRSGVGVHASQLLGCGPIGDVENRLLGVGAEIGRKFGEDVALGIEDKFLESVRGDIHAVSLPLSSLERLCYNPFMALELNKLTSSVDALGASAAKRLTDLNERLPAAEAMLKTIRADDDELLKKIKAARVHRWAGAIPTSESASVTFPLPPHPNRLNIVAADGSQIYPDRHGIALYYLINIGSIVFRHGLDQAPGTASTPQVFFEDDELYYAEENSPINGDMVNAMRDVRELGELARVAPAEVETASTVTLLDNGLLMYISLREQNRKFSDEIIEMYLKHLDTLRECKAIPAGVVDRPRAANVIRLLNLAKMELSEITPESVRSLGPFAGITDAMLFESLKPGERSAVFVNAAPDNDRYEKEGHRICFFYLNAGRTGKDSILRIEVPEWTAKDTPRLDLAHTAIVEQCRVSDGFPYVLMRAHELAVVTVAERREFEQMVIGSLIRRGITPSLSQKAQGKQWTGSGKRRYPR